MKIPEILIPFTPYIFKSVISIFGAIAVEIFRRKSNAETIEKKMSSAKKALDRVDQIIIGTVGAMVKYKKDHGLDGKEVFVMAKQIINNSLTTELKAEARKAVENLDAYILRGIENAVLEIKLKEGKAEPTK